LAQNQSASSTQKGNGMFINHSEMVAVLVKSGDSIAQEMTGPKAHLIHMVLGISGEAGELLDAVKKATIYNKDLNRANVVEELGDIEFYMEGLRTSLGISRQETLDANVAKLNKRYHAGTYTDTQAQQRADKS
jgi:NTP pyrophosphatase (non-canonical NTP hydrolase)